MTGKMRWPAQALVCAIALVAAAGVVSAQAIFDVSVPSALLMVADTGQILYAKEPHRPVAPASLAKVMTLLIAMDHVKAGGISLDDPVSTSARASAMGGSRVFLSTGEVHTLENLLKAVAIAGANDAAVAVAEYVAGSEAAFVDLMNEWARQLGMENSRFANSHGLPPAPGEGEAKTTAADIAKAARALINAHPEVLDWTRIRVETFRERPLFNLYNTNDLVGKYEGLDGLRTGYIDEAGWLIVATARRADLRLIAVIMEAQSEAERQSQTVSLLDYGFQRFVPVSVAQGQVGEARFLGDNPERVPVRVERPVRVLVPRGGQADVTAEVRPFADVKLPVRAGAAVGELIVRTGGEEALRVPVYAAQDVEPAGSLVRFWRRVRDFMRSLFSRGG